MERYITEEISVMDFKVGDVIIDVHSWLIQEIVPWNNTTGNKGVKFLAKRESDGCRESIPYYAHRIKTRRRPVKCETNPCRDSDCDCVYGTVG